MKVRILPYKDPEHGMSFKVEAVGGPILVDGYWHKKAAENYAFVNRLEVVE